MATFTTLSIENLDHEHRNAFSNAVHRVLSTDIAVETYAQIIDGVPLCEVAWDRYEHRLHQQHPINSHVELCPGALETAKSMRDEMDTGVEDRGNGDEEPNVYFQSSRPKRTYMVYQLTDVQQNELLDYLLWPATDSQSEDRDSPPSCPFPISATPENKVKIDPEFAIVTNKIYRDIWERPAPRSLPRFIHERDVVDPSENPGAADEELRRLRGLGL
ncbi:hypothetical protein SLS62_005518 [Diatrype stigma]|uniref:Uncharacterized protein n=1 Tax=Diatrype stigma TaxID=117547 RepID=A0AAN9UPL5_9PEZI